MRRLSSKLWLFGLMLGLSGCAGGRYAIVKVDESRPERPQQANSNYQDPIETLARAEQPKSLSTGRLERRLHPVAQTYQKKRPEIGIRDLHGSPQQESIQQIAHDSGPPNSANKFKAGTLTVDGRTFRVQLVEEIAAVEFPEPIEMMTAQSSYVPPLVPPPGTNSSVHDEDVSSTSSEEVPADAIPLDLPTALKVVGGQHPAVGFAQWKVQEAYARLDRAETLWLPSIQTGLSFHRHDGNYQASDGRIVDVNRNSFQYGLGNGATGAGTTPRPGIVAQFHLADALFQPEIAEKTAWAEGHAANGVYNKQLLDVALAYLELLEAEQDVRILEESRDRTAQLAKLTHDFAAAGQGLQADADRLQTELIFVSSRLAESHERVEVASARLSQTLSIEAGRRIVPLDTTVVPIEMVSLEYDKPTLISTGLANRPELKEAQALVSAACEQYKRQKYAPFVPSMLLGFSTGEFGGGLGNNLNNVEGRYDFDAAMTWEIRNLGFGEQSSRRETHARIEQVRFEKIRLLDQIAREVAEAHAQVVRRSERIELSKQAIESARNSFQRNMNRIRDGQGLPLEALQSVQALEVSRRNYLRAVADYNAAQFQLQWALGWTVVAPSE